MSFLIGKPSVIKPSEITDQATFRQRRRIIQASAALGLNGSIGSLAFSQLAVADELGSMQAATSADGYKTSESPTTKEAMTAYNNFTELGSGKSGPSENASSLVTDPWSVEIAGECEKPGTYTLEDLLKPHAIEERIYRLRCVEAWSMVVPWLGISLADMLQRFEPNSRAKYVAFETLYDPERLPGQKLPTLDWPYVEGLTISEAMHPLSILSVGCYGDDLPPQCGAPLRLVVPWKYGFKSIKSIVKISFVEKQPPSTWNLLQPGEYGFYANVNPQVSHPRWSQAKERRITSGGLRALFTPRIDTEMFNGYAEQVASLYSGMDLSKNY